MLASNAGSLATSAGNAPRKGSRTKDVGRIRGEAGDKWYKFVKDGSTSPLLLNYRKERQ